MKEKTDLAYLLFQDIQKGSLEYCYRGAFTKHINEGILSLAENNIEKETGKPTIKKRVYFIMVEGLQNITRHQDTAEEVNDNSGIFFIQLRQGKYYITTGNVVENDKVEDLKGKLEMVNSLDKAELKKYYREVLENGEISKKGGAGLGLIEMSRKSGNKLYFNFKKINKLLSYFYFNTKITSFNALEEQEKDQEAEKKEKEYALDKIIEFHQILNEENIILSFKGMFDQENMLYLLSMIEGQMGKSPIAIKVFNVIMELLQNNVKHGKSIENEHSGNPGIFFVSKSSNHFNITSGNYILAENYTRFKAKLDYVNSLSCEELDHEYNKVLLDEDNETAKKTGLGFLDIRIKTEDKLTYKFYKIKENFYFYTLTAKIKTKVNKTIESLYLTATEDTPEVKLDAENNIFSISKRSYPENAIDFYDKILFWLKSYGKNPNKETKFVMDLEYFNTASSKQIMKIILNLERISTKSKVKLIWKYKDIDEDMLSLGTRFQKLVDIDFEFIEVPSHE